MSEKYKNKYRIKSTRLQNWNYGWNAVYFVTICTYNSEHYFGRIINNKMELSAIGIIANILWFEIKNHFKNIELDGLVVMPNHVHGIIVIDDDDCDYDAETATEAGHAVVETGHALSLQSSDNSPKTIGQKRFQNIGKNSLPSIIGSYKSAVTKHSHRLGYQFKWQTRYYDHIIRNEKSYIKIKDYIINNPINWNEDKFYK